MAADRTDAAPARRSDGPRPAPPGPLAPVLAGTGPGDRLAPRVAGPISRTLGVDVSGVRVHTDAVARRAAAGLGARAFAVGQDVYLGAGADPADAGLMAHEVAHTVQQRASAPAVRLFTPGSAAPHEREAEAARGAVTSGGALVVAGHAPLGVQRQEAPVEDQGFAIGLLERYAPDLAPIIRKGVVEWLRDQLLDAIRALVDVVLSPVRQAAALLETLQTHFGELVAWIRVAGERIAKGDCGPLAEAAARIQQVVEGVTAPVVDRVKQIATRIGAFFTDLWNRVGAPIWDTLKTVGGEAWKRIQWFAGAVWDSTAPIRRLFTTAWNWIKRRLGLTDEGGGVIGWLQEKAAAAWAWVKGHLEPYRKQLAVIAGVLVLLSPAGPILVIGAGIAGLVMAARWIAKNLAGGGAGAVRGRRELLDRVIPAAKAAVAGVGGVLKGVAATLLARLESVVGALAGFASSLAAGVLRVLVALIDWLAGLAKRLAAWAEQRVLALAGWVEDVLARLSRLLEPVRRVLERVGRVLENVVEVVAMVAEKAWNAIPACIRNPVVDFLTTHILRKIPLIAQLVEVPNVWTRMKNLVIGLIRGLFRGGSLTQALEKILRFAFEVLKVPLELAQAVWTKAKGAFDLITKDPTGFLKNVLLALKGGLSLFWENILKHLLRGITDWLFAVARQAGITPPADLSFKAILGFVLEVLGISMAKVFTLLEKRLAKPVVDKLRVAGRLLAGAWEWVTALITEGPAGLWRHIQDQLSGLWDTVKGFVVDWLIGTFIEEAMKKLISFLDPTGIMAIVNGFLAVWRAIESAIEYLRQLLEMLNGFLDGVANIAAGAITGAASRLEKLMAAGLSVAIGFLANQFPRLKRLGSHIREMVEKIQKRVEAALEKLIDRGLTAGRSLIESLQSGAATIRAAITGLFGFRREFTVPETGERHTLTAPDSSPERITVASEVPQSVETLGDTTITKLYEDYIKLGQEDAGKSSKRPRAIDLVNRIEAALKKHFASGRGTSAPGIGNIARHNQQVPSLRGRKPWEMRSEHVVARRFANVVLQLRGFRQITAGGAEYNRLHTVMTYLGAADKMKDRIEGTSESTIRGILAGFDWSPAKARRSALDGLTRLAEYSTSIVRDAVGDEWKSLGSQRGEKSALPDRTQIDEAAYRELLDLREIIDEREAEAGGTT